MSLTSKIKNIAIISLSHHHTIFLEHLSHLFSAGEFSVTIFGTKQQYQNMKKEKKKFFTNHKWKFEIGDPVDNLDSYTKNLNGFDIVIIQSIRNNFKFFSQLQLSTPIILCVHNINYWFNPKKRISFLDHKGLYPKINYLKQYPALLVKENLKQKILSNVSIINLHNPSSDKYLRSFTLTHIITHLPFTYYIPENIPATTQKSSKSPIIYAISGQIVDNRKDYIPIMESFQRIHNKLKRKSELHFIGRFNCSAVLKQQLLSFSKKTRCKNFKVVFYDNQIPPKGILGEHIFNQAVANCDVLLSAQGTNALKVFKGYQEYFGSSSASGLSFDAIRFSKPVVLGASHEYLQDIKAGVDIYKSPKQLDSLLLKYQSRVYINSQTKKIKLVAKKYSKEFVLNHFLNDLQQ